MESSSAGAMSLQSILTGKNRSTWEEKEFWQKLCPNLTITDDLSVGASSFGTKEEYDRRKERLVEDGYVLVDDTIEGENATQALVEAIAKLHKTYSLPATFVLLFDETWRLAARASSLLSNSTNPNNVFNFDMLAWYIDPREGDAGFSPHRDRQPDDIKKSFYHDDKMAKYVTMWLALSNATPENSCLYVIPKPYDPGYTDGDDESDYGPDPLARALPDKCAYQHIRALPRKAGQSLLFTHRILHWGSRGNPKSHDKTPRVAISFVCSDPSFEKPYLNNFSLGNDEPLLPPFKIRLLLVCAQLLIYYQRFDLPKDCIKACHDYVKENEDILEESYRKKVYIEFIKAMQEDQKPGGAKGSGEVDKAGANHDETGSDEEDEAVLEAMLDAEAGGYGNFEDDFDEIEGDVDAREDAEEDDDAEEDEDEDEDFDESDDESDLLFGKRRKDAESPKTNPSKKLKTV